MQAVRFFINGIETCDLKARNHFVEWALSVEQENNKQLIEACKGDRCMLMANAVYQQAVYPAARADVPMVVACVNLVMGSGVRWNTEY